MAFFEENIKEETPNTLWVEKYRPKNIDEIISHDQNIKTIKKFLGNLMDWKNINDLIPNNFKSGSKYKKTGKAGIWIAIILTTLYPFISVIQTEKALKKKFS